MASEKTINLGLNKWIETDRVDFQEVNYNFDVIDGLTNCKSEFQPVTYTGAISNAAKWHIRKYTDGTAEISTNLIYDNVWCSLGDESPYYTEILTIEYPIEFSEIISVNMHLTSKTFGYIHDITEKDITNKSTIRVFSTKKEEVGKAVPTKTVNITVKGVM